MRLYLIRHPQPQVPAGVCYGSSDLAVRPEECARVRDAVLAQLQHLPSGISIFSSPLRRCADLAELLAEPLADGRQFAAPQYDACLAEMHFGRWEMQSWEGLPRAEIDTWANDLAYDRPGDGESVVKVAQRVQAFTDALLKLDLPQAIIVCHAGTIRLLNAQQSSLSLEQTALLAAQTENKIGYGELQILDLER